MDILTDVENEMTALTAEDVAEHPDGSDEVENLRNSLREALRDDTVQPMMQCLMMDSSFSMVTMQGEDSGIAWETTPSRCTTPWASEAGHPTGDLSSLAAMQPATPGSLPAGKIIFVMDEELFSRQKRARESEKRGANTRREVFAQSSENISRRPELVGVSQPNVKTEEGDEEETNDPLVNKEQRLFSLVSEGSEILNIVVSPKLYTVDEEESKGMTDNLSYLEESPVTKASEETDEYELAMSTSMGSGAAGEDQVKPSPVKVMDPPGAPVARPLGSGAAGDVDYFEAYTLIDAQAPGGPAVVAHGQVEQEARVGNDTQDSNKPVQSKLNTSTATTTTTTEDKDAISLGEISCELLDDVFYGSTENCPKGLNREDGSAEGTPSRLPLKPSGSTLFGSQEDILTPIFLPEGPPKIIDPILLEEPKAMAFLYTDLYEEAVGSRKKEEDTESVASEKSFHSRHSDREARGYLEKYVLIDETPGVEVAQTRTEECPEEGPRLLAKDLYDFGEFLPNPEKGEMPNSEEEITDFFRSSANSSPCDKEPFARSLQEDEAQLTAKTKTKTSKSISITVEKVAEIPVDPMSTSSFEFPSEEPDWGSVDDYTLDEKQDHTELWKQDLEEQKPVAPPRKKATSPPKTCLYLTPLVPTDVVEGGGDEQREEEKEEKEVASPAETADDGEPREMAFASEEFARSEKQDVEINTNPAAVEGRDTKTLEETREAAAAAKQTEEVELESPESTYREKHRVGSMASPSEPAKDKGQCMIL